MNTKLVVFLLFIVGLAHAATSGCSGTSAVVLENDLEVETLSIPCDPATTCKSTILLKQKANSNAQMDNPTFMTLQVIPLLLGNPTAKLKIHTNGEMQKLLKLSQN
jgi:hypothetical protein